MDVWVIETGEYEDRYVFGVADSVDAAVDCVKREHSEPYVVEWDEPQPHRQRNDQWALTGRFEAVAGTSAKHTANFDFTRTPVHSLTSAR